MTPDLTLLYSKTKSAADLSPDGKIAALKNWLCVSGSHPIPNPVPIDVHLRESRFGRSPLNFIYAKRMGICKRQLLESLGVDNVNTCLQLGKVYSPEGIVLPSWCSFLGAHRCLLRGSKNARYKSCEHCGYIEYYVDDFWTSLWPAIEDVPPILDFMGSLVLRQDLVDQVPKSMIKQLGSKTIQFPLRCPDGISRLSSFPIQLHALSSP